MTNAYVYEFMMRKKDNNPEYIVLDTRCIRLVVYQDQDPEPLIEGVKQSLRAQSPKPVGKWRVYRSVNLRDTKKSELELVHKLTERFFDSSFMGGKRLESMWKTTLMQPRNKAERKFLIDIDSKNKDLLEEVVNHPDVKLMAKEIISTPFGYHVIARPFNSLIFNDYPEVEVKKDALQFVEMFEV